jgi:hypothetical protein
MALDTLHAQAGTKAAALQVGDKFGDRTAKGAPLIRSQRPEITISVVREVICWRE